MPEREGILRLLATLSVLYCTAHGRRIEDGNWVSDTVITGDSLIGNEGFEGLKP